jgi:exopolyphosphatase / guanosine-5'-triphosphate,3'-diphosphate pyrophosphatase
VALRIYPKPLIMLVPEKSNDHYAAVVDIGSNSVRLVIYRIEGRSIWPLFNEKILAGLGENLSHDGTLNPAGKAATLVALRRFRAILDAYDLGQLHVVATAAIREATDGRAFSAQIEAQTGFRVRILSGAEEAYFSAQGVRSGHFEALGIVGDLGGSSLELFDLDPASHFKAVTLPLGPFHLGAPAPLDPVTTYQTVLEQLGPLKGKFDHKTFYAVGGAWRALALIWLQKTNNPLQIVQQYEIPARSALDIVRLVISQSPSSLEKIPGVSKRRMENLGYGAQVLRGLIETFEFETVCFSAQGLREGILYDSMPPAVRAEDPLIAGCQALGHRQGISDNIGQALTHWVDDFYQGFSHPSTRPPARLIEAAARLADIGARLHPDHRADLACEQVLRAPISGQSHWERVFLACAIFSRYSGDAYNREPVLISRILGDDGLKVATELGLALRLGCDLSAKSPALLTQAQIVRDGTHLLLNAREGWDDLLLGEQTRKRARALAGNLKLTLRVGTF